MKVDYPSIHKSLHSKLKFEMYFCKSILIAYLNRIQNKNISKYWDPVMQETGGIVNEMYGEYKDVELWLDEMERCDENIIWL